MKSLVLVISSLWILSNAAPQNLPILSGDVRQIVLAVEYEI
jgi:hypothetical protein